MLSQQRRDKGKRRRKEKIARGGISVEKESCCLTKKADALFTNVSISSSW